MENHHFFNGKIHYTWQFSIAMLVHQRVQQPQTVPWPSNSRDWPRGCGVRPLPQDVPVALLPEIERFTLGSIQRFQPMKAAKKTCKHRTLLTMFRRIKVKFQKARAKKNKCKKKHLKHLREFQCRIYLVMVHKCMRTFIL